MSTRVDILVYDGDCGFCTGAANWLARHWQSDQVIARTRTELDAAVLERAGVNDDDLEREVWWLSDAGNAAGADAIGHALLASADSWAIVGRVLLSAPVSWIAQPIYRWVAQHRYLLPGATAACDQRPRRTPVNGHDDSPIPPSGRRRTAVPASHRSRPSRWSEGEVGLREGGDG